MNWVLKLWIGILIGLAIGCFSAVALHIHESKQAKLPPADVKVLIEDGHGSGVHIGGGRILTAAHVIDGEKTIKIKTEDGKLVEAELLWANKAYDVALVSAPELRAQSATLTCAGVHRDTEIEIAGNPYHDEFMHIRGHVASVARPKGKWKLAQSLDATVVTGNSGGPVYVQRGYGWFGKRVVGIVVAVMVLDASPFVPAKDTVGIGYMTPTTVICGLLGRD